MAATVEESTPPDMATAMVAGSVMGDIFVTGFERYGLVFVISHPSDKNKDVARVGHPGFVARSRTAGLLV
jgi:hypothetical protein